MAQQQQKPQHVQDWESVQRFRDDYRGYDAPKQEENDLIERWLSSWWELTFMGQTLRGEIDINTAGLTPVFTLRLHPEIEGVFEITGWYEYFRRVEEE